MEANNDEWETKRNGISDEWMERLRRWHPTQPSSLKENEERQK
jgi:hypothetical protein